jgi:hypothetical protein
MSKNLLFRLMAALLITTFSVFGPGCKKEENVSESLHAGTQAPVSNLADFSKDFSFENGTDGWKPTSKSMLAEISLNKSHGGKASLKVVGSSGVNFWNFANSPEFPLQPGRKYRLTGWMMVEKTSSSKNALFLKCAITENTKWISNANTNKYNLHKLNEWQELSTEFVAPAQAGLKGHLAIEKGTNLSDIAATIYIDDLKIEAI